MTAATTVATINLSALPGSKGDAVAFYFFDMIDGGQSLLLQFDVEPTRFHRLFRSRNAGQFDWAAFSESSGKWEVLMTKRMHPEDAFSCCSGGACGG